MIVTEMKSLLDLFEEKVPDHESNRLVWEFCDEKQKWLRAYELHSMLRDRNAKAVKDGNKIKECQYCFEEVVAKTLYNLTMSNAPFDPDSPYWVIKSAFVLAKEIGIPMEEIVNIVLPDEAD